MRGKKGKNGPMSEQIVKVLSISNGPMETKEVAKALQVAPEKLHTAMSSLKAKGIVKALGDKPARYALTSLPEAIADIAGGTSIPLSAIPARRKNQRKKAMRELQVIPPTMNQRLLIIARDLINEVLGGT